MRVLTILLATQSAVPWLAERSFDRSFRFCGALWRRRMMQGTMFGDCFGAQKKQVRRIETFELVLAENYSQSR